MMSSSAPLYQCWPRKVNKDHYLLFFYLQVNLSPFPLSSKQHLSVKIPRNSCILVSTHCPHRRLLSTHITPYLWMFLY